MRVYLHLADPFQNCEAIEQSHRAYLLLFRVVPHTSRHARWLHCQQRAANFTPLLETLTVTRRCDPHLASCTVKLLSEAIVACLLLLGVGHTSSRHAWGISRQLGLTDFTPPLETLTIYAPAREEMVDSLGLYENDSFDAR